MIRNLSFLINLKLDIKVSLKKKSIFEKKIKKKIAPPDRGGQNLKKKARTKKKFIIKENQKEKNEKKGFLAPYHSYFHSFF